MFKRFQQRGTSDPTKSYIITETSDSLLAKLMESFKVLEMRFANFDQDQAGVLSLPELKSELSLLGFHGHKQLDEWFSMADLDNTNALDFSEFLVLMYLFSVNDEGTHITCIFKHEANASYVKHAFEAMENAMHNYDADKSRKLDYEELEKFFTTELPDTMTSGAFASAIAEEYPSDKRDKEVSFPKLMHIVYVVLCKMPGSKVKGTYLARKSLFLEFFGFGGTAKVDTTPSWNQLRDAFQTLEEDFQRFDKNNDMLVDYTEITSGIPTSKTNYERLAILSRLEKAFYEVDRDDSRTLDFYEYMYLAFMMTQNGSYHDLVAETHGSAVVKKAFIDLHISYRHFDADKNNRLTYDELQKFFMQMLGRVPDNAEAAFNAVKYTSTATQDREAVDVVRFMKMLYIIVMPEGTYSIEKYGAIVKSAHAAPVISQPKAIVSQHPNRFTNVQVSLFKKTKLLGQGGQGCVHMGSYDGIPCAGKTFLGDDVGSLAQDLLSEIDFFRKLDHPNCHYLLGAKTTLDNGGLLELTEVCENGSLFDMYAMKGKRFDKKTSLRLARECALGMEEVHRLGFMHRDIKSLNVFVDKNMVAKVADFGMVTNVETSYDECGTCQWAAPEVVSNMMGVRKAYDKRCDVYSYAILLHEIFYFKIPYSDTRLDQMEIAEEVHKKDIRPTCLRGVMPQPVADIMSACWQRDPAQRPTFTSIQEKLAAPEVVASCA